MSQQNLNMVDDDNMGPPIVRPQFMVGADRSGERGGPARGDLQSPTNPKTNVKKGGK